MRSIGKRNISKLKTIVAEEKAKGIPGLRDRVMARIPAEWYDIWESAWSEIQRVVEDEVFAAERKSW
jgi:hypothetical protein